MIKKLISTATAASIALALAAGCSNQVDASSDDAAAQAPTTGDGAKTVQIADAEGNPLGVTVTNSETSPAGSYADVRVSGRDFELAQWVDVESGALHSVVSSADGTLRYESIVDASGSHLNLKDDAGQRTVSHGESLGTMDAAAAALLLNFRASSAEGETPYVYQTWCVGYDTSDPSDWHLTVGSCTCAHWYSIICTMN